jgi:hypothetical protein
MSLKNWVVLALLFCCSLTQAFYIVEEVSNSRFLTIEGQTYEVSSSCTQNFAETGDELLFTSISASSAHCDHVLAKNIDNGKFCQLFCL